MANLTNQEIENIKKIAQIEQKTSNIEAELTRIGNLVQEINDNLICMMNTQTQEMKKVEKLEHTVNGNGKVGLVEQMKEVQSTMKKINWLKTTIATGISTVVVFIITHVISKF